MCSGPLISNCLVCSPDDSRTIENPGGLCVCNVGLIDVGVSSCGLCHYSCLNCNTANLITGCSSCPPPDKFRVSSPVGGACPCSQGYYDDGVNALCQKCHYSCDSCSGGLKTNCQSCNQSAAFRTLSSANECLCKSGYYDSG